LAIQISGLSLSAGLKLAYKRAQTLIRSGPKCPKQRIQGLARRVHTVPPTLRQPP
jgi:hypothetical protein